MKLASDPAPLALLSDQRPSPAQSPLLLEAVEHRVERPVDVGDLRDRALQLDPAARLERIDPPHQPGQPLQRIEHSPQQHHVDGDQRQRPNGEDEALGDREGRADGRRRERKHQGSDDEATRVDQHHAPEQRHPERVTHGRARDHGQRSPCAAGRGWGLLPIGQAGGDGEAVTRKQRSEAEAPPSAPPRTRRPSARHRRTVAGGPRRW
jgi:hypothetical protein